MAEIPARRLARCSTADGRNILPVGMAYARIAWIETKRPTGRGELSPAQVAFRKEAFANGALYWIIRSPEDIRFYLPPKMELDFTRPLHQENPARALQLAAAGTATEAD